MTRGGAECPKPAHIALIVRGYDEAVAWFTGMFGFTPVTVEPQAEQERQVFRAPLIAVGESAA